MTQKQPHLQWSDDRGRFEPSSPAAPPTVFISLEILQEAHQKYGTPINTPAKKYHDVEALADTGCQTCTAGMNLLTHMKIPPAYLIPTKHRITGITDTSLKIIGALMLAITFKGKTSNQMVYISDNTSGLYLSETTLKDLEIVHEQFPDVFPNNLSSLAAATVLINELEESECLCIPRSDPPERPSELPFKPTTDNVDKQEAWLFKAFEASAFHTCTHQPLQAMTGAPVHIKFKDGAVPHAVHSPLNVPHHWEKEVRATLDRDSRLRIIEAVPQGTPSVWCSRMVVVPKKDGTPRRTVDLQKLNDATLRETHHTPTPFNLVSRIPPGTIKSVCDAWNGYHSLELAADSKDATTFITPWGRHRYCRAPMGLHTSGDAYTRRFDDITMEVSRKVRCIDDTLLWDSSIEESFWHMFDYLHLCSSNGLVFNKKKFLFAKSTIEFAGFEVTPTGYRPPERIISAIRDFPKPENITDLRSWFGLVNQVAYAFAQTKVMEPFRELLASKTRTVWFWDSVMDNLFQKSKEEIARQIQEGVQAYEMDRPTCLATDWSRTGLGFVLSQKHCRCRDVTPNCGQGH